MNEEQERYLSTIESFDKSMADMASTTRQQMQDNKVAIRLQAAVTLVNAHPSWSSSDIASWVLNMERLVNV